LLELAALPNEPYFAQMKAPEAVDVVKLARLADMPVEQFQSLNSGYRGPVIIQTTMRSILLPVDKLDLFQANLHAASRRSISAKRLAGKTVKDNSLRARAATLSAAPGL
jgi:membrane-bound lytic murein transglycosylase D